MRVILKEETKRLFLAITITVFVAYACMAIATHLFFCYYREQWGISAWIMHSPPLGCNFTNKLAIVREWAAYIGIIAGLTLNTVISQRVFRRPSLSDGSKHDDFTPEPSKQSNEDENHHHNLSAPL